MDIARALGQLGILETDARFYLAALELGEATTRQIAEKAGIARTSAYDVFARLRDQGLVAEVSGTGKAFLVLASPPDRLYAIFEERRRSLESLMPELESLHAGAHSKPKIRFFQGAEGVKTVLNETNACRSGLLRGILSMRDLYQVPGRAWMDAFVERRIAANVSLRAIRSPINDISSDWPSSSQDLRELRYAPRDFLITMTMYVYDEKVAIISTQKENFAVTIESAEFAELQRNLFEALWLVTTPGSRARSASARFNKRTTKRAASRP